MSKSEQRELLQDRVDGAEAIKGNVSHCHESAVGTVRASRSWTSADVAPSGHHYQYEETQDDDDDREDVDCEFEYIPLWRGGGRDHKRSQRHGSNGASSSAAGANQCHSKMQPDAVLASPVDVTGDASNESGIACHSHHYLHSEPPTDDVSPLAAICRQISSSPVDRIGGFSEVQVVKDGGDKRKRNHATKDAAEPVDGVQCVHKGDCSKIGNDYNSYSPQTDITVDVVSATKAGYGMSKIRRPPPVPPRQHQGMASSEITDTVLKCSTCRHDGGVCISCDSTLLISDKVRTIGNAEGSLCSDAKYGSCSVNHEPELISLNPGKYPSTPEDNIYEEVPFLKMYEDDAPDVKNGNEEANRYGYAGRGKVVLRQHSSSTDPYAANANRKSLVEEVMYEVERVQRQHVQVLSELNLDVENMIMVPPSPTLPQVSDNNNNNGETNGNISAVPISSPLPARRFSSAPVSTMDSPRASPHVRSLSLSSCPGRDLPSLPSRMGSPRLFLKRDSLKLIQGAVTSTPISKRKWIRLPTRSKDKIATSESSYSKSKDADEPVYMLYDDSHRQDGYYRGETNNGQFTCNTYSDDGIYEDIEQNLIGSPSARVKLHNSSFRRSDGAEDSEDFESYEDRSDAESEKSTSGVSLASLKNKLRSVKRRMTKNKDDGKSKDGENGKRQSTPVFAWRKDYDFERSKEHGGQQGSFRGKVHHHPTEDDVGVVRVHLQPPLLPPIPLGLTPEQIKRRYIISTLVHSENTYVATLKRLIQDYKKPLEDSHPPILSKVKIDTLFFRVPEIQQCHAMFRIALTDCIKRWDKDEKIGDVFVASFSKSMVLEMYSGFINNFSTSMELAKQESKRKSAFADFLKVKQITSHDRLSFFGLMVKPVQRFPQFILLLQDLLKHTPHGHHDRMNLQLALTQLESLAEMLNERKRESEQHHAVKELMRHVSAKFSSVKSISDGSHYLLREDTTTQLKFDQDGHIVKSKERRLYLLNDLLICVSVSASSSDSPSSTGRCSLKWAVPVTDVEIQEESSPTLNRLITSAGRGKTTPGKGDKTAGGDGSNFQVLYQEMADLMHDFEVMSRITALLATLKKSYPDLSTDITQRHSQTILRTVQEKDEEMKWMDNCCLQLLVPFKAKTAKELITFQMSGPSITKEWISELRLAQLGLDTNNSPAWDIPEQERRPSTKMPLFVRALPVYSAAYPTEVKSACSYICSAKPPSSKKLNYLWVCSSDGVNSHISIFNMQQVLTKEIASFDLTEVRISAMEAVPGWSTFVRPTGLKGWTIWMGTDSRRILIFSGTDPEKHDNLGFVAVSASVLQIRYYCDQVFAALANGKIVIFHRLTDGSWNLKDSTVVSLSTEPVTSLLPHNSCLYCACGRKVWVLDCVTREAVKNFAVQHEQLGNVYLLAQSGIGLWINLRNTATICLYHMETFRHLQDINVASNINRILAEKDQTKSPRCIFVTSLLACRGLLWVGTNVGVMLTIPLPRLEGVPIISGRASLSYHMLAGPVTTLMTLNTTVPPPPPPIPNQSVFKEQPIETQTRLTKQLSLHTPSTAKAVIPLRSQLSSPTLLATGSLKSSDSSHHHSPLLVPKRMSLKLGNQLVSSSSAIASPESDYDVYGLYGDLLNVRKYFDDAGHDVLYEPLRRSQPDLLPNTISTLDRRLRMKAGRPKSLDLTNLCSGATDSMYISSSSEGGSSSSSSSMCVSCTSIGEPAPNTGSLPNNGTATLSRQQSQVATKPTANNEIQRTIMTIVGGRGYMNVRQAKSNCRDRSAATVHANDAYIVLWELKL